MSLTRVRRVGPPVFVRGRPFHTGDLVDLPGEWVDGGGWEVLEAATPPAPPDPPPADAAPADASPAPDLTWTRAQLDAHATALAIDPSRARSKQAVLDLIHAAGSS